MPVQLPKPPEVSLLELVAITADSRSRWGGYTPPVEQAALLSNAVKQQALAAGFDLVGVAAASTTPGADRFRRWLDDGMHGEMSYLLRTAALREDPRRLLPGCRTLVVVAMSYHTSLPPSTAPRGSGRVWVSRYAWGRDYHRLLKKRLVRLGRWLSARVTGCTWRACVDTAPVAERSWAVQAGLGWIGKHGVLVNRTFGSELFLGVLLTDTDLLADTPLGGDCGRCSACIDACPTGAVVEPGIVDARRCLAYLTIEHHSSIAGRFLDAIAATGTIAGCDLCQEACPWNHGAPADLHDELQPAPHRYLPLLEELRQMGEEELRAWRAGSPLGRLTHGQLHRNLTAAAGTDPLAELCEE